MSQARLRHRLGRIAAVVIVSMFLLWCYELHIRTLIQTSQREILTSHLDQLVQASHQIEKQEHKQSVLQELQQQHRELELHQQQQQQQQKDKEQQEHEETQSQEQQGVKERTSDDVFALRKERVYNVCQTSKVNGGIYGVFTHPSGVLYCMVPKAGCTFWKRVLRALTKLKNATKENVFKMSRNLVHEDMGDGVKYIPATHNEQKYPTRFIVTRDPYSRLLSAYLDKAYLVDFWKREVVPLRGTLQDTFQPSPSTDFLREHYNRMAAIFNPGFNPSKNETACTSTCGKYATFAEFVQLTYNRPEPHWMPIYQICDPCKFKVTHLSRMETFTEDARVILAQMGAEDILDDIDDEAQVNEELETIVSYNFQKAFHSGSSNFFKHCISPKELAYRLWHNFQWRGYIDPGLDYAIPDDSSEAEVKKNLMTQLWVARESGLKNPDAMKIAKNEFKRHAYMSISKEMFESLNKKYSIDFQLFDYEKTKEKVREMLN